jgi:hypothetical protein
MPVIKTGQTTIEEKSAMTQEAIGGEILVLY